MKARRRIEILDLAKCLAIFLVVWGHTFPNSELLSDNPPMIGRILYSTHMPLFFFLSGMSSSVKSLTTWKEWRLFLRKNVLTIALPFVIWSLVFSKFSCLNCCWILYGSWQALNKVETVTSLWFLSCLFTARILLHLVIRILSRTKFAENKLLYLIPSVVLILIGYFLPRIEIGYPWCLDVAFVATGCMLAGVALKESVLKFSVQKGSVLLISLLGTAALFAGLTILRGEKFKIVMMCKNLYPYPVFALVFAILGSIVILIFSMLLKRMADEWLPKINLSGLSYIGQHTLGILLLHKPFLQEVAMPLLTKWIGGFCPETILRLLATVISMFVSLWLCKLIEYYIPELVGIFSKDKLMGKKEEV